MSELPPPIPPPPRKVSFERRLGALLLVLVLCGSVAAIVIVLLQRAANPQPDLETIGVGGPASSQPSLVEPISPDHEGLNQDLADFLGVVGEVNAHFDSFSPEFVRRLVTPSLAWDRASGLGIESERFLALWVASAPRESWYLEWGAPELDAIRNALVRFDPVSDGADRLLEVRELFIDYLDGRTAEIESLNKALDAVKRDWQNPDDGSKSFGFHVDALVSPATSEVDATLREFCDAMLTLEQYFDVDAYNARKSETVCSGMRQLSGRLSP